MLIPFPVLKDNYSWLYARPNLPLLIVDIPDAVPLLAYLTAHKLTVEAVLLTHRHDDHIQGVAEFSTHYPNVPVYASSECADKGATVIVNKGEITTPHYQIQVLPSGGHTEKQVSFFVDGQLFCGDALFSAGCGRVFTGDYEQMFDTLQRFNALPDETLICPGHEYTLANLAFAETVLKEQNALKSHRTLVERLRRENKPSVPTTLKLEKQINPFLQAETLSDFIRLRRAKDNF